MKVCSNPDPRSEGDEFYIIKYWEKILFVSKNELARKVKIFFEA